MHGIDSRFPAADAAFPHGSGTDRELKKTEFVLVDCGGSLHGYQSDVTRVRFGFGLLLAVGLLSIVYADIRT